MEVIYSIFTWHQGCESYFRF